MQELAPETLVHNRYRVKQVIASGGMGVLYRAFDEQAERDVASKQNSDILSAALFMREAKLLAKLRHPNLPTVFEVFEENNQQFFVMDYIDGRNLDQLLGEQQRFSVNEVSAWALQILDALAYL